LLDTAWISSVTSNEEFSPCFEVLSALHLALVDGRVAALKERTAGVKPDVKPKVKSEYANNNTTNFISKYIDQRVNFDVRFVDVSRLG
jgi:cell shape-determining protein MreC